MPMFGPARRMRRRRAVVAGAAVGGAAYYAGKKGQQAASREDDQEATPDELETEGQTPAAAGGAGSYVDELEQLAKLHEEGILTDEEFDAKKKEILGL